MATRPTISSKATIDDLYRVPEHAKAELVHGDLARRNGDGFIFLKPEAIGFDQSIFEYVPRSRGPADKQTVQDQVLNYDMIIISRGKKTELGLTFHRLILFPLLYVSPYRYPAASSLLASFSLYRVSLVFRSRESS